MNPKEQHSTHLYVWLLIRQSRRTDRRVWDWFTQGLSEFLHLVQSHSDICSGTGVK
jgi:hypothetical protein